MACFKRKSNIELYAQETRVHWKENQQWGFEDVARNPVISVLCLLSSVQGLTCVFSKQENFLGQRNIGQQ